VIVNRNFPTSTVPRNSWLSVEKTQLTGALPAQSRGVVVGDPLLAEEQRAAAGGMDGKTRCSVGSIAVIPPVAVSIPRITVAAADFR
jgi:hypothetical protein